MSKVKIVAFSGSIRASSFHNTMLKWLVDHPPEGTEIEFVSTDLPLINPDLFQDNQVPESVKAFKAKLAGAHAFYIGVTEYNHGVSAALKNAIDWASKGPNVLQDATAAIFSAAGMAGGAHAQDNFRLIAQEVELLTMNKPELLIRAFEEPFPFDFKTGELKDEKLRERQIAQVIALRDFTLRVGPRKISE